MNKRAVSNIIVTVILVLLAIVAVAIVWGFISGYLNSTERQAGMQGDLLGLKIEKVQITGEKTMDLFVKREFVLESSNMTGLKIAVFDGIGTEVIDFGEGIEPYETKKISVSLKEANSLYAQEVSIAPVLLVNGKEVTGSVADTYQFKNYLLYDEDGRPPPGTGGTGGGDECAESWTCGGWGACTLGTQTRTCTDSNACGTTASKPSVEEYCRGNAGALTEWATFGRLPDRTSWDGVYYAPLFGRALPMLSVAARTGSAAIVNGYVYFGSENHKFYQLNATDVSQIISTFTIGDKISSSPAVANGYVYFIGSENSGGTNSYVYQLNADDVSREISRFPINFGCSLCSPAVANGYVYIGGGYHRAFYKLDASGVSRAVEVSNFTDTNKILGYSSPSIAGEYVYVGISEDDYPNTPITRLYQLNASNISQRISSFRLDATVLGNVAPAVANGYVYFGTGNNTFYQLDANDVSREISRFKTVTGSGTVLYSPAVANGYVYIGGGNENGIVYQLDANDISREVSRFTSEGDLVPAPSVSNGYVYVGSAEGKVYQLDANDISKKISEFSTSSRFYSTPAVSDKYVYVGNNLGEFYQLNASKISSV